jgi:hypothetical protein
MFKSEKRRKEAEASSLSRMGTAILRGHKIGVTWLPEDSDDLGYTSGDARQVYIAWYHEYFMKPLQESEHPVFRTGIFAHELLHQLMTNFEYTNKVASGMTRAEAGVFMQFANTLEDPAIEYFAPNYMGGRLLDALRFNIRHVYQMSPGIDKSSDAFSQLINALVHFGDMGIVKGNFTFPEAYEYFKKIAPKYNEGITCPDSRRRIDIALDCMETTRPLWEEMVRKSDFLEKLLKILEKEMKRGGLHLAGDEEKSMSQPDKTEASERRGAAIEKIELMSDNDAEKGNGTGTGKKSDNADKENSSDTSGSSDSSGENGDNETSSDDKATSDNKAKASGSPEDNSEQMGGNDIDTTLESIDGLTLPDEAANEVAEETYEIDDATAETIERNIKAEEMKLEKKAKAEDNSEEADEPLPDFNISSTAFTSARCLNKRISGNASLAGVYNDTVKECAWEIKVLKKTLEKIFRSDRESTARATSGSYNILRGTAGTTARMFDKRRDPDNLKDAQVMLLIDQSGSMCGEKIYQARRTAIVLAEALTAVGIPYYIMGFSADRSGYDVVHEHYVTWNGKKHDREAIVALEAHGDNFDGYSIRYAAEILKARNAGRKILFVISDGEPAADKYMNYSIGVADTTNAIKTARKDCITFGIAVGNGCSPKVLQGMYGKDFIYCQDPKLLVNTLCKKLEKVLKAK